MSKASFIGMKLDRTFSALGVFAS